MGAGAWSTSAYNVYTTSTRGMDSTSFSNCSFSAQELYKSRSLDKVLNPYKIVRECCDSEEHPYTFPVILALDVTGSMGGASVKVAQKLNEIMTELYQDENVHDIEFCVMAIGDLAYDRAPIQMSQFESDVRIAEQLDKVYFEAGGGGNTFESYTAAWYMGVKHAILDCWKRGQKGIIITLGDECPNPYLPAQALERATGDKLQGDVETKDLYNEVIEKYDVYHISVDDAESSYSWHNRRFHSDDKWRELLGEHYFVATLDNLAQTIINIITDRPTSEAITSSPGLAMNENGEVAW